MRNGVLRSLAMGIVALLLSTATIFADETWMPTRGVCAHRGASDTHPENTIAALREAIRQGAQMLEFDIALTKDDKLVLMHDATIDRTTNGQGRVVDKTLAELKQLDAGDWKHKQFKGERIPTLDEALAIMPENIWLNVHLKGGPRLAAAVTKRIVAHGRTHQAFLACDAPSAAAARRVDARIKICNMERQANSLKYVNETINAKAEFIQLLGGKSVAREHTQKLQQHKIRINYCCTNDAAFLTQLFQNGVQFPLVDRLTPMIKEADKLGVERLQPLYRSRLGQPDVKRPLSRLLATQKLAQGAANQGLAVSPDHYFTSTARTIHRYDKNWKLIESKQIRIKGVNHFGAIDYHDGYLWAGLLHGPENGKHDPKLNKGVVAKIRARDLTVEKTWDITRDVNWIDPVCFDGKHIWVGDLSDLGIHRYRIQGDKLVREGILRYPREMHFSQGIRIRNGRLYSIHTFGSWDGLFEFDIPKKLNQVVRPGRVWEIAENRMHLEGFDFVPGKAQIWHAQGRQVDRYELQQLR